MSDDVVVILDCETTGLVEPVEPVEVGYLVLDEPATLNVIARSHHRYKPSKPIECGALATHHIIDEELAECPPASEAAKVLPAAGVTYLVAHNVDFDWGVLGKPDIRRIDTCALARACWPECDSFSLGALTYYLDRSHARERLKGAHGALDDCLLCLDLLRHIVAKFKEPPSWEKLWRASEKARIPTRWAFGKHRGQLISETPRDYLEWCTRQPDMDPYVLKAVRSVLYPQREPE